MDDVATGTIDWHSFTALYSDDQRKGKKEALSISVQGMQDPDTHLIYHDTLQRRIARLESQLRIPRSEQHDFSYTKLKRTTEVVFKGIRLDAMIETDARTNEPVTAMSRFLQAGNSPPTSPDEPRSKGNTPPRPGSRNGSPSKSPLKKSASSSGFEIRKPLFKRVKVESFSESTVKSGRNRRWPRAASLAKHLLKPNPMLDQTWTQPLDAHL